MFPLFYRLCFHSCKFLLDFFLFFSQNILGRSFSLLTQLTTGLQKLYKLLKRLNKSLLNREYLLIEFFSRAEKKYIHGLIQGFNITLWSYLQPKPGSRLSLEFILFEISQFCLQTRENTILFTDEINKPKFLISTWYERSLIWCAQFLTALIFLQRASPQFMECAFSLQRAYLYFTFLLFTIFIIFITIF